MKKFFTVFCSLTLTLAVAACGNTEISASENETVPEEEVTVTQAVESTEEDLTTKEVTTLEDLYINSENSEDLQEQVTELKTTYSDIYSDIEVKIEGNTIYYIYTYASEIPTDTDFTSIKASLEETLLPEAKELHDQVGSDEDVTYISEFHNPDGTLLFSVSVEG